MAHIDRSIQIVEDPDMTHVDQNVQVVLADGTVVDATHPLPTSDTNAVIKAPDSVNRNTVQPTDDANPGIVILPHSATQSAALLSVGGVQFGAAALEGLQKPDGLAALFTGVADGKSTGEILEVDNSDGLSPFFVNNANKTPYHSSVICISEHDADAALICLRNSSSQTNDIIQVCDEVGPGSAVFSRFTADGSLVVGNTLRVNRGTPGFGVFSKASSPAGQQAGGAATAAGTYGAGEQAMLQKLYDMARAFGFLT